MHRTVTFDDYSMCINPCSVFQRRKHGQQSQFKSLRRLVYGMMFVPMDTMGK